MTPTPEQTAAAVEHVRLALKSCDWMSDNAFVHFEYDKIIAALAAHNSEVWALKALNDTLSLDNIKHFESLRSAQSELAEARKVLLEYANPANWIERMGGRGDFDGYDYKPHASGHPCDEASAAMQQEQKPTPSEGPASAPTSQ